MEQYYTPELEDIHIGYECELFLPTSDWWKPDTWTKFKISENGYSHTGPYGGDLSEIGDVCNMIELNQVRTLYLTKEQIEAEGWEIIPSKLNCSVLKKEDYYVYLFEDYTIQLGKGTPPTWLNYYYKGKCPSINEFRTICKLLNIK